MIQIRKSADRGHANHGWLDSYHTFSFADYHDSRFVGFRDLRVINEDRVQAGRGFEKHRHQDMEIISYILEGELSHHDSTGSGSVLHAGDVQRMSAGRGVMHSEFNHSSEKEAHFLQIWIKPKEKGIAPSYEEKHFSQQEKQNCLRLIVSPTGEKKSLTINQDVKIYASILEEGKRIDHALESNRYAWIQIMRGAIELNEKELLEGDGAAVSHEKLLQFFAKKSTEFLLFDLG